MADSTVADVSKMKVVDLRKELKTRGLPHTGDKAELVSRLQAAMQQEANDEHGDINLDSDIDSEGVLDEDDKSQHDFDDTAVETLSEELALADNAPEEKPSAPPVEPKQRTLKRKITGDSLKTDKKPEEAGAKKIVLNRAPSITLTTPPPAEDKPEKTPITAPVTTSDKVKITADVDAKTKMEMRAKRFGLPLKMTEDERKEARKQRFGQNGNNTTTTTTTTTSILGSGSINENINKLKQRAERFGQSVSKIMTDIETKEKLEKRKAKFGMVK